MAIGKDSQLRKSGKFSVSTRKNLCLKKPEKNKKIAQFY
jgi:hypothetical protein